MSTVRKEENRVLKKNANRYLYYLNGFFSVGWIKVEWDTGLMMPYRYGTERLITAYDIEPSDEPRILLNEPIAVGCLVRRGIC